MILSSIDNMDRLMTSTREGIKSSNLSPSIQGPIYFMILTLSCSYLRLQRLELVVICSPSSATGGRQVLGIMVMIDEWDDLTLIEIVLMQCGT